MNRNRKKLPKANAQKSYARRLILSALPLAKFVDKLKSKPSYGHVQARYARNGDLLFGVITNGDSSGNNRFVLVSCPLEKFWDGLRGVGMEGLELVQQIEGDLQEAARAAGLTEHERCIVSVDIDSPRGKDAQNWKATIDPQNRR